MENESPGGVIILTVSGGSTVGNTSANIGTTCE